MNRRIKIAYYWLLGNKYNIGIIDLLKFLLKPRVKNIALKFIKNMSLSDDFIELSFNTIDDKLYWPKDYSLDALYQICAETFDRCDWHHYEYKTTKVQNDDIIVDIGAAEGLFSLSVIRRCKRVFIIEPNSIFFNSLKRTFSQYIPKKAKIFNVAVGDQNATVRIKENEIAGKISMKNERNAKMVILDDLLKDKTKIDYIKADLEGYEMNFLKGAQYTIKSFKPKMAIACYHSENDYREIIKFVKNLVPKYKYHIKGLSQFSAKPVMVHFWVNQ